MNQENFADDLFEKEQERLQEKAADTDQLKKEAIVLSGLREDKQRIEAELKEASVAYQDQQQRLADMMKAMGLSSFKIPGVGNFIHARETFPRVTNEDMFFELLEAIGKDHIIKRTVHNATLRSFVNGNEKEGLPPAREVLMAFKDELLFTDVDDFIGEMLDVTFVKDKVQIRKA